MANKDRHTIARPCLRSANTQKPRRIPAGLFTYLWSFCAPAKGRSLERGLGDVQGLAAAVVDVGAVALKPAAGQAHSLIHRFPLDQDGSAVAEELVVRGDGVEKFVRLVL